MIKAIIHRIKVTKGCVVHWSEMENKIYWIIVLERCGNRYITYCWMHRQCFFGTRSIGIDNLNQYSPLIIDDLSIERNTGYSPGQTYDIMAGRYRSKLPMTVTTNLTLRK